MLFLQQNMTHTEINFDLDLFIPFKNFFDRYKFELHSPIDVKKFMP